MRESKFFGKKNDLSLKAYALIRLFFGTFGNLVFLTTTSSFFANNVDAIASAGFRSPSGILRLLATAKIEPSYDHLIILSVRFRHSFRAPILGMLKETASVEKRRGVHRDPGGTGMLKARLGVHLFACWPRRDNFFTQDFYSIWALPTGVAAERTGSTEACPTPTSSRGRRRGSCALAGPELNCGLRHFPRCSSAILR